MEEVLETIMPTTTNKQRLLSQLFSAAPKGALARGERELRPVLEQFLYAICREGVTRELADQACGTLGRSGYWFAVASTYGAPPAGGGGPVQRTVVTGAVGSRVAGVTVSAGGTPYPVALARFGRAFLAVLPSGLGARDVTVAFRLRDGTTRLYTGRPALGVLHIRRAAL